MDNLVKKINMRDARSILGNISQTNHFLVNFSSLKPTITDHIKKYFGVEDVKRYVASTAGLLCLEASLPGTSLATGEVRDNFMGIPQEFAHTRLYNDVDFTFYVDSDYKIIKIFEGWIDYISSGSRNQISEMTDNYYRRMVWPDDYKCQTVTVHKFERDFKKTLEYKFINIFPKMITAIPVSYGQADLLKLNVSFNYDRYVMNPSSDFSVSEESPSNIQAYNDQIKSAVETVRQDQFEGLA